MAGNRVYLFNIILCDGGRQRGVYYNVADKKAIARTLDEIGVDYIEDGCPGANPTAALFFAALQALRRAKLMAFGMIRRLGLSADNDPGLAAILNVGTPATGLVSKTWDFHVDVALAIDYDVRATIAAGGGGQGWRTLDVLANIIDASMRALAGTRPYKLTRDGVTPAAR